jgi:endonuclease-8
MPEGHTIHRLAGDQSVTLAGQSLHVTSPQGRFAEGAKRLDGLFLARIEAAGKHLFYHFAPTPGLSGTPRRPGSSREGSAASRRTAQKRREGIVLHVHLGLFGKYRTHDNPAPPPRGAVRVRFEAKRHTVDLNGPNQCELIPPAEAADIIDGLGPDPLRADADPTRAWTRIHTSKQPIGLLLMDQSVIAGIGNIYRSEILHLLGIHPRTPGTAITRKQFNAMWKLAVRLLNLGVKHNRIITIDEKDLPKDIAKASRKKLFRIFKKPHCPDCGGEIERFVMASRKVFACPACQRH